MSLLGVKLR